MKRPTWPYWIGGIAAVGLAAASVIAFANSAGPNRPTPAPSPSAVAGAPVDGIKCETEMVQTHFHASLALLQDGNDVPLPAGIGISQEAGCLYWLHTHQADGVIHVESPGPSGFTLGQFFDIWGQPLSSSQAGPISATAGQQLYVYVDGEPFRAIRVRSSSSRTRSWSSRPVDRCLHRATPSRRACRRQREGAFDR